MMSNGSQEQQQSVISKENSILTCQSDIQQQQSITQSSAGSTNSVASSSINNKYNESYLREKYGIKDFRINLVDCMKCYVRIPRCTLTDSKFEQPPVSDTNQNVQTNLAREVQEYHEEQEMVLEKQHHQTTSEIVEEDYQPIDYLDDYNPMNTLIIVDLPWPETSE
ncbi:unnamed protein product [Rotaria sordida]|uniref:Uncharacterized protein n=1 Tax=Rotaria sordida TaxID=392033 RepID=A0A816F871_9BILA|nr:unnamed protein product [Rotaria sordida]CAF1656344.1 unnamed protein product [Rotaria sordida]